MCWESWKAVPVVTPRAWVAMLHSVAVVGAGLVGSSVARWAAELAGAGTALVGPAETATTPAAWQDEGRMTRLFDRNPHWRELAEQAELRYRQIELQGGCKFFHEVFSLVELFTALVFLYVHS